MSRRSPSLAEVPRVTSKLRAEIKASRKSIIDLSGFIKVVRAWQEKRPPMVVSNSKVDFLVNLLIGEILEVLEERQNEGLANYVFKAEKGETIDIGFFLASLARLLILTGGEIDTTHIMRVANGQSNDSNALDRMMEVAGNLNERSLEKDLEYLWELWVSYLIHMKYPVSPTKVLREYTFPKNDGNYSLYYLRGHKVFEQKYRRKMDEDEGKAYFAHYRKATRLIRDFIIKFIDPQVEHTGLRKEHLLPYEMYIYSFMYFPLFDMSPQVALETLENRLYIDFGISRDQTATPLLRLNTKLPN